MLQFVYYVDNYQPQQTPSAVPISVPIAQMNIEGSLNCNFGGTVTTYSVQKYNCNDNINICETESRCGLVCNTTGNFQYTFKGVQFAIYGTISPDLGHFDVYFNNELVGNGDESKSPRQDYALVFTSKQYEYKEYTVKIISNRQERFEIYKLVYWPALNAKRINITEFDKKIPSSWVTETDGIGGKRQFTRSGNDVATKTFKCTKFWIYGAKYGWSGRCDASFGHINANINGNEAVGSDLQKHEAIMYESTEFASSETELIFSHTQGEIMLQFVYYVDLDNSQPPPTPSAIPISIPISQMEWEGTLNCDIVDP